MNTWLLVSSVFQWILILALLVMNTVLFRQLGIMVMGSVRGVESSGIPLGRKPPAERLQGIAGETWSPEDWKGKPFIIFFAGTYCSECASIMPTLRELSDRGVKIAVLLFNNGEEDVANYLADHDVPGLVIPVSQEVGHRYDAVAVPFAYAIGARGEVVAKGLASAKGRLEEIAQKCGVDLPHPVPAMD